ncbi:aminoglycoside 3-N-acetyltransferase [Gordonia soli]|uniref:Aminoglycoside N(3)-acetyltransferase n=1 Tax=Gordonia soli NBRC 108243 TaxID=1223545 RepID=M0QFW4_9ACTN|nr:aminoglycoside 3-N-acetyltransferase [Gordonia soli]GAC67201.1 putative aminoglycoside 3-N-acetyltransferase [Gordonia soli NBRC 108243]
MSTPAFVTRDRISADLQALGLAPGDIVMAHGALRAIGPLLNGPDDVVGGLVDAVAPGGTVLGYTDWSSNHHELLDDSGRLPDRWRDRVAPFDPLRSRAIRDNGALPEFLRTWPGSRRSGNPGASVAAVGDAAEAMTADHPLDYGYGDGSPLARLVDRGGKVVMLGAPWDTMTLLHHAEHLADIENKRVIRYEAPLRDGDMREGDGGVTWHMFEEFDTGDPIVEGPAEDYFADIVTEFVASEPHRLGTVGAARTLVVDAAAICAFAVDWLEHRY